MKVKKIILGSGNHIKKIPWKDSMWTINKII